MSKRNENIPGYKKTRVGWIPEEWECVRLRKFGGKKRPVIKAGPFGSSLKKEYYVENGYKIYGQEQVIAGDPYLGSYFIDEKRFCSLRSCEVFPGDILLSLVGTIGKALLIPPDYQEGIINPRLLRISFNKNRITPRYAKHYLEAEQTLRLLNSWAQGGTMGVLNAQIVSSLPIPLPPLQEQKKIAEILSAWDKAIEQMGRLIDAKQWLKKGLMQQLLTGWMRFSEFNHETHEIHEREKGELPEGWKACKLDDCFKERKETAPDLPLLAITSDRGVIPRDEVERKDTSNADKSKYKRIALGDIGYNTMRMWQGVSAVSTLEGIVSPAYTICTPKKGHSPSFFGYLFKYPPMIHLFHRFSQGLVSDTLNRRPNKSASPQSFPPVIGKLSCCAKSKSPFANRKGG